MPGSKRYCRLPLRFSAVGPLTPSTLGQPFSSVGAITGRSSLFCSVPSLEFCPALLQNVSTRPPYRFREPS